MASLLTSLEDGPIVPADCAPALPVRTAAERKRTFLFLQGPHGTFFPRLGKALAATGSEVRRINFNGGDLATWKIGANFRGRESSWPAFLRNYIVREGITDLLLFGDNRPVHAAAIPVAREAGVQVHVFEEGYIRNDWVTLERDGVNGNSTLPRDPAWYLNRARDLPPRDAHPAIASFPSARGWAAFFYYAEVVLQHWRFPLHRSHRPSDPVWEGISYLRRFGRRLQELRLSDRSGQGLQGRSFFIFPLQLDSDYQIRRHSPFGDMRRAIEYVLASFAGHAPEDMCLVVKLHPLDSGLKDWRAIVTEIAQSLAIVDRVIILEHGDLEALVRASSGMAVVNSTSGTLALAQGKPVKVLGDAVYNLAGVTDQAPLDQFWGQPNIPDPEIYDAFCRVLSRDCLIRGSFLSDEGMDLLVAGATRRLLDSEESCDLPSAGRGMRNVPFVARDAARNPS